MSQRMVFDSQSGYYFDAQTGLYFEPKANYYWDSINSTYYNFDTATQKYVKYSKPEQQQLTGN